MYKIKNCLGKMCNRREIYIFKINIFSTHATSKLGIQCNLGIFSLKMKYKKEMKCMMLDDEVKEKKKNSHYRNAGHLGRR